MTELHIERKERSILPWVLAGLVLLALLVWFLFGRSDDADPAAADLTATAVDVAPAAGTAPVAADAGVDALPPAVREFVRFAEARSGGSAAPAHEYTATGLRHLADALGAIVPSDTVSAVAVQPRLAAIRARADTLQLQAASGEHALQAREAFLLVGGLMRQMQESRGDPAALAAPVAAVNDAAQALEAQRPLLDQTATVERFFEQAAVAVRAMAPSS